MTDGTVALHRDGQDGEHGGVGDGIFHVGHHLTWGEQLSNIRRDDQVTLDHNLVC